MRQVTGATNKRPLYTAKTLLVPREAFSLESASGLFGVADELLRLAGMAPEEGERVVFSDPTAPIVALMAVPAEELKEVDTASREGEMIAGVRHAGSETVDPADREGVATAEGAGRHGDSTGRNGVADPRSETVQWTTPLLAERPSKKHPCIWIFRHEELVYIKVWGSVGSGVSRTQWRTGESGVSGISNSGISAMTGVSITGMAGAASGSEASEATDVCGMAEMSGVSGTTCTSRAAEASEATPAFCDLRLAEVLCAPTPEDVLFYVVEFSRAMALDGYRIRVQGAAAKADAKLLKRHFKRVKCE